MKHLKISRYLALALMATLILSMPNQAMAVPIGLGYDSFITPDFDLDLTDEGLGTVKVEGDSISGKEGDADTIIERTTDLSDGETGTIDIELVALSLRSVDPIDYVAPIGYNGLVDLYLTLDDSNPSLGEMNIFTHDASGGTFESFFNVFFKITLKEAGTDLLVAILFGQDEVGVSLTPNEWVHTASDDFLPLGDVLHTGMIPLANSVVPVPAALPLFGTGLAVMGLLGWRRKRKAA